MTELQTLKNGLSSTGGLDWSAAPPSGNGVINSADLQGSIASINSNSTNTNAATTSGGSSLLNPSALFSNPLASVGVEYGRNLLRENTVWNSGLGGWLRGSKLRYYFRVNQSYIGRKTAKLLFPFFHYDWLRVKLDDVDDGLVAASNSSPAATYQPPIMDINAPDLYIGVMSFVTFVVVMGYALGSVDQFDPELLGVTASRSLICLLFEVAGIFACFYLSDAPVSPPVLDLFALAAYKYVSLNLDMLVGLLFGSTAFYVTFMVLAVSTAFFMVRTLNGWVPSSVNALGTSPASPKFRGIILIFALLQLILSLFLLYPALPAVNSSRGLTSVWNRAVVENASKGEGPILSQIPSSVTDSLPIPQEKVPTLEVAPLEEVIAAKSEAPKVADPKVAEPVVVEPTPEQPAPVAAADSEPKALEEPVAAVAPVESVPAAPAANPVVKQKPRPKKNNNAKAGAKAGAKVAPKFKGNKAKKKSPKSPK